MTVDPASPDASDTALTVAVVGHVEWVEFARVPRLPTAGEIVHARDAWAAPAGGGAVAAVQLARLAGSCTLFTALGEDEFGHAAKHELERLGATVEAVWRSDPQRRAFVHLDDDCERTITVLGERMGPRADDPLPWERLATCDAVYFTAGDVAAVEAARAARALVATVRGIDALVEAGVAIDALVASANDSGERYETGTLEPPPAVVIRTDGERGGTIEYPDGSLERWPAADLPADPVDSYGAGDSFAAGLTYGLGAGLPVADAVALGARCGAACVTGRGPYGGQLERPA